MQPAYTSRPTFFGLGADGGTLGDMPGTLPSTPLAPSPRNASLDENPSNAPIPLGVPVGGAGSPAMEPLAPANAIEARPEEPLRSDEEAPLGTVALAPLRAAGSVLGRSHTVVDVLHARALKPHVQQLRGYLTIRLADVDEGERALRRVRAVIAAIRSEDLVGPPGLRARLYGIAREVAHDLLREMETTQPTSVRPPAPPWSPASDPHTRERLTKLREGLRADDAELLELRHVRELTPEDLAHVLERDVGEVLEDLQEATFRASELVHLIPGEALRELLREAFQVETKIPTTQQDPPRLGTTTLEPGSLVGERYRIQVQVGTGAFGDVYRAEDVEVPGHVVALKILHQAAYGEEDRQSALRELRHLASVFHPSVVHLKDHGWHESRLWFVMPWYDGETLESRMRRAPLTRAEARRVFEPLARALAAVHTAGLRHQDVKPENVFLAELPAWTDDPAEQVLPVLIDLGVAATQAEMLVAGTPTYFAPEVAAQFATVPHRPRVTPKADVFSLALALRNALEPDTQEDVSPGEVDAFIERRARTIPDLPTGRDLAFLEPHFERWMSLDADERPSASEFAEELAVLTEPEARRRRRRRFRRRAYPVLMMLAGLGVGLTEYVRARDAEHAAQVVAANQEAEAVREDLAQTAAERARVEADAERIRSRLTREQLGRAQLETRLASAEASLTSVRTELRALRETLAGARAEADARGERIAALSGEVDAREARIADLQRDQRTLAAERDALQEAHAQEQRRLQAQIERAERAQQTSERRVATLREELADAEADVSAERARRAAADARADALEQSLRDRTREAATSDSPATDPAG